MRNLLLILSLAVILSACGGTYKVTDSNHKVAGETVHRVLIGIDFEGMKATFENGCRITCEEEGLQGELLDQCTEACVADKTNEFIDSLTRLYEQIEGQQGGAE